MKLRFGASKSLKQFFYALIVFSMFAFALSLYRMFVTGTDRYWFLMWNLVLAWVPLLFAAILYKRTPKGLFWSWRNLLLLFIWLMFLPNAFYLVTDFIHLTSISSIGLMYDVVLISTYAWCGFILGYLSLFLVHVRFYQKIGAKSHWLVAGSLLLSGFAIYLGRYLRWNSWDVVTNPLGIIFDVSNSLINPHEHILSFSTTLLFFAFLSVVYAVLWYGIKAIHNINKN